MQLKRIFVQSIFWRSAYFLSVLILNICIARFFASAGSGSIYFLSTIYAFIILLVGLSLESGMGFYTAKKDIPVHQIFNVSFCWALLVTILSFLLFYFFWDRLAEPQFSRRLIIFSAVSYISGNLVTGYCSAIFYARNNFYTPNLIGISCNLVLVFLLYFINRPWLTAFTGTAYLYIYFLIFTVQAFVMVVALKYSLLNRWRPELPGRQAMQALLKYSLTAYVANILFMLAYRVDYWFVEQFCTKEELGNYIQVSKLNQLLILVPSFLATAIFPMVASGRKEEVYNGLAMLSRLSLIVIGMACLAIGALGEWLFPLVFGKSFQLMTVPFLLLIPGILSLSSGYTLSAYYSGKNKVSVNLKGCLLALVFIVIADYFLVPVYGIKAAAAVSSIGYILFQAYVLLVFKKEYGASLTEFFLIKKSDLHWLKNFAGNMIRHDR